MAFAGENGYCMIVMSTHGLTGLAHVFFGSVTEKVIGNAHCPVMIVKSFGKSLLAQKTVMEELQLTCPV